MADQALMSVFANAAALQKIVLVALVAAVPAILAAAILDLRGPERGPWRSLIGALRFVGPLVGILIGAMNSFHMARTIQRVPFEPTAKQLAPGLLEVSTLLGLGALVGLVAVILHCALGVATSAAPERTP